MAPITEAQAIERVAAALETNELGIEKSDLLALKNSLGEGIFVYVSQTRFLGVQRFIVWLVFDSVAYQLNAPTKSVTPSLLWPREVYPGGWRTTGLDLYSAIQAIDVVFRPRTPSEAAITRPGDSDYTLRASVESEGVFLELTELLVRQTLGAGYWEDEPDNGAFIVLLGTLRSTSGSSECVTSRDFGVQTSTGAETYWLDTGTTSDAKSLFQRDYPGSFLGQCVSGTGIAPTFMVFDVGLDADGMFLIFGESRVELGAFEPLPVDDLAAYIEDIMVCVTAVDLYLVPQMTELGERAEAMDVGGMCAVELDDLGWLSLLLEEIDPPAEALSFHEYLRSVLAHWQAMRRDIGEFCESFDVSYLESATAHIDDLTRYFNLATQELLNLQGEGAGSPSTGPAVVPSSTVNIRSGPGTSYPVLDQLSAGRRLTIVGRNADSSWWQVCCVEDRKAWVAASVVEVEGDISSVPIVTNVPLPPTPVPSPTALPRTSPARETVVLTWGLKLYDVKKTKVVYWFGEAQAAGGLWLIPFLEVRNAGSDVDSPVLALDFYLQDSTGETWPYDPFHDGVLGAAWQFQAGHLYDDIDPGRMLGIALPFDIPAGVGDIWLRVEQSKGFSMYLGNVSQMPEYK